MAATVDNVFQSSKDLSVKLMTEHSWGTAIAARAIARRVHYENIEEALVCGLMHDIGKPVLMQNQRKRYHEIVSEVYRGNATFNQLELQAFGFSHAHVGALLVKKWNFPPQLIEAVGYHHNPMSAPTYKTLSCIMNLANLLMVYMEIGFEKEKNLILEKQPAVEQLNLGKSNLAALESEVKIMIKSTLNLDI